jgi:hypothetical protein
LCHNHHLLKLNSYQMVLHRPVETATTFRELDVLKALPLDKCIGDLSLIEKASSQFRVAGRFGISDEKRFQN